MHGGRRTRKKHLSRTGWRIVQDERAEKGYLLILEKSTGERVSVEAASRPRAYAQAIREVAK